jgi:23S rRNA pseudouridine2605 synthase
MNSEMKRESMRINRYLARAGVASRRDVEIIILDGRISINSVICRELATRVTIGVDVVALDGQIVALPCLHYYKFYKPCGMVTTLNDPHERNSLGALLAQKQIAPGVVPAGRLDKDSEGLLILTNDGDLLQKLMHPSFEVQKIYRALIDRRPSESNLDRLREGVQCEDFVAKLDRVVRMGPQPVDDENPSSGYWLEIILHEGHKREIREMLKVTHYHVLRLVRIAQGPIEVGTLQPGELREISWV